MSLILYTRADGGVSIVVPNNDIEKAMQRCVPSDAVNVKVIEQTDIPSDRYFRNAWKDTGKIEIDMPKAREIHKQNMRYEREPILAQLDIEFIRAIESGDTKKQREISDRKQALRDVTLDPGIENAQTPEELKAVWPEALK